MGLQEYEMKKILFVLSMIFLFAYLLNFSWEAYHAVYLYAEHNLPAEIYVPMLIYVSTMDGLVIIFLYLVLSWFYKSFIWIGNLKLKNGAAFFLLGLIVAVIIEYRAVYIHGRWSYNPNMPTVWGIGISPLVQLSLTGLFSLWIVGRIIRKKQEN